MKQEYVYPNEAVSAEKLTSEFRAWSRLNSKVHLANRHVFRLHVGGKPTPITRNMLGSEALNLNRVSMNKYGSGKCQRLTSWENA